MRWAMVVTLWGCITGDFDKGTLVRHSDAAIVQADPEIQKLDLQCIGGIDTACYKLADAWIHGTQGLPKRPDRGDAIRARICKRGLLQACPESANGFGIPGLDADVQRRLQQKQDSLVLRLWRTSITHLPKDVFALSSLEELSVGYTSLQVLPAEISQLKNLRHTGIRYLPYELGDLQHLESLDLQENCIINEDSLAVLERLPKLKKINLNRCPIPKGIERLTHLEELNFSGGGLQLKLKERIPSLARLPKLRSLNLSSRSLHRLPDSIKELQNLRVLNLAYNPLLSLPESFFSLSNLETLSIQLGDHLQSDMPMVFPEKIFSLSNLQELRVDGTFTEIPEGIARLPLRVLQITAFDLKELPSDVSELDQLQVLNVGNCALTSFPMEILDHKSLRELRLSFSYGLRAEVPKILSHPAMAEIELLRLDGLASSELVFSKERFPKLKVLFMGYSQLQTLPKGLEELPRLEVLDLTYNDFSAMPDWVYHKASLRRVELNANRHMSKEEVHRLRHRR